MPDGYLQALVARRFPIIYSALRFVRRVPRLLPSYFGDIKRYALYSSVIFDDDREKLRSIITARYHNVEKGLSLPSPRPGFGVPNIKELIKHIDRYVSDYGVDDFLPVPVHVIGAYLEFNRRFDIEDSHIRMSFERFLPLVNRVASHVGVKMVNRLELLADVDAGGIDFITSRSSVRQYSRERIQENMIESAVRAAQKCPVVCNRQSGRIRSYRRHADIIKVLEIQGGARGFAEEVDTLFCVTVDLRCFNGVGERYQGWIDGGLFAMNFLLGLHAQGVGSCCLNWSKDAEKDREMHDFLKIPDYEIIIMFVAAGMLKEMFPVACSSRLPIEQVLSYCECE
ncbi:nitroreductase family protein [Methyloversatilis sp.]|uniref:nitroreductase family protein n=1 Tax=Methyloversatilis sp. TaxID=2569862 RepID=UPI0027365014|nr:nitroreductase family protein [Methyloversatilis sp.]MDP3455942.1 nitroreductase family protein [Methyloversatilis sp.]